MIPDGSLAALTLKERGFLEVFNFSGWEYERVRLVDDCEHELLEILLGGERMKFLTE